MGGGGTTAGNTDAWVTSHPFLTNPATHSMAASGGGGYPLGGGQKKQRGRTKAGSGGVAVAGHPVQPARDGTATSGVRRGGARNGGGKPSPSAPTQDD